MNLNGILVKPRAQIRAVEQSRRIEAVDDLRGLAVVFMAMVHVQNIYSSPAVMAGPWAVIVDFFGGPPAAPVFMMIMGVFFSTSSPKPLRVRLRRGFALLATGYLLNFFRGVLPVYVGTEILGLSLTIPEMFTYEWLFFNVDILIFAGLAYIIMALCHRVSTRPVVWLSVAVIAAITAPLLWGIGEDVPVLKRFIQPLWSSDGDLATFPLFPWVWFPLLGMVVGEVLNRVSDRRAMIKSAVITGGAFFCVGLFLVLIDTERFYHDYGQMKIGGLLGITGIVMFWSLGVMWVSSRTRDLSKPGVLRFLGRNLTTVYIVHWLILGWSMLLIPADSLGHVESILMTVGVLTLTSLIVKGIVVMRRQRPGARCR